LVYVSVACAIAVCFAFYVSLAWGSVAFCAIVWWLVLKWLTYSDFWGIIYVSVASAA